MSSNHNHNNSQPQQNMTMDRPLETQSAPPSPSLKASFRSNRRAKSLDLDLPRLKSAFTINEPIFCCQDCISATKEDGIDNFGQIGSTCPPFQDSVRSIASLVAYVIEAAPISKNPKPNTPKKPIRHYAFLENINEYREIDSILFTYLQDVIGFDAESAKARLICPSHREIYNLTRYTPQSESNYCSEYSSESDTESDTEGSEYQSTPHPSQLSSSTTEAFGTSTQPLSPYQISVEKRKFMIRKLSYGRRDQMEEIINCVAIQDEDRSRRERWGWGLQHRSHKKEAQEMLDFEMKYCLGKMRMFFLDGKMC